MTNTEKQNHEDTTYGHVIKYTGLFGGVQGIIVLVSVVRNKVSSVLLGPAGLALVNIYNNVMKLLHQATNLGISFSAVRTVAETYEREDARELRRQVDMVRMWSVVTAVLGMFVCMVAAPWISYYTFGNYDYTFRFLLLAPILGCLAVSGGELAVLKGMKRLKSVALSSVLSAVATLAVCIPAYFFWGVDGIVSALLGCNLSVLAVTLWFSHRAIPWHRHLFSRHSAKDGVPMVKLGLGYIIAGVFGQGAEYIVRVSLLNDGSLADVGLYNSGYTMAVSYASMVFIAIETDFFPRLSAAVHDLGRQNRTINQQVEVCMLLIVPFLVLFTLVMPFVVPLLFSGSFSEAVPMATCATLFMYFKALTMPVAYLPLAKGDSGMFMCTELACDVFTALAIPFAFRHWGLLGTGWALSVGGLAEFLLIVVTYSLKYKYRFPFRLLPFYAFQFLLLSLAVYAAFRESSALKWGIGAPVLLVSMWMSFRVLRRETDLIDRGWNWMKGKWRRKE